MTLCIPISPAGLDQGIVAPILRQLAAYHNAITSDDARAMMLRTAAAESELMWLEEHADGPSRGYWQMLPSTARDTLLRAPRGLVEPIGRMFMGSLIEEMTWNPWGAAVLTRAYWWLDPNPIPSWQDAQAQAEAWKRYWNTELGAGTPEQFLERCHQIGVEAYIAQTFGGLT